MLHRLITNWVYGGSLAGVLLLLLAPLITHAWSPALAATFLLLPIYMVHQYEEHDDDRFRRFLNAHLGKGRDVLSPAAVFIINVPGVWGVIGASTYLAWAVDIGWGLIAVYLVLVNAFVHVISTVALRRYNPGLATGLVLFVPAGTYALWRIQRAGGGSASYEALGLAVAIGIHVGILVHVRLQQHRAVALSSMS